MKRSNQHPRPKSAAIFVRQPCICREKLSPGLDRKRIRYNARINFIKWALRVAFFDRVNEEAKMMKNKPGWMVPVSNRRHYATLPLTLGFGVKGVTAAKVGP